MKSSGLAKLHTVGLVAGLFLIGCGGGTEDSVGVDSGADIGSETAADLGSDGADAAPDGATDTRSDTPADVVSDSVSDSGGACGKGPVVSDKAKCLTIDTSAFTMPCDPEKCVVAQYTVPGGGALHWGRHGGPLGFENSPEPTLVRFTVPSGTSGELVAKRQILSVPDVPKDVFYSGEAVDLPFFGWTAFAYTGSGAAFPGELLLANDVGGLVRYKVNGFFSVGGLGATTSGRLLYTGLSTLTKGVTTTNAGGLYAADTCGTAASPGLLPLLPGDTTCSAPLKVGTWEAGSSGPVVIDPTDHAFAILSTFGGNNELRGFEKSTVQKGSVATEGAKFFGVPGYISSATADGHDVVFQNNDAKTFEALDVEAVGYVAEGKVLKPLGVRTFLKPAKKGTKVVLLTDDKKRLWVGLVGAKDTTFFVFQNR